MEFAHYLVFTLLIVLVERGYSQCPRDGVGFYAHSNQCDAYFECVNGTTNTVPTLCPDGLVFNEQGSYKNARCDYPSEVSCENRPILQQAQSTRHCPHRWGLFPHEEDCGRFWNCVDGTPYSFECPPGLAFNEGRNHCDWADQVDRCDAEAMLGFKCPQPDNLNYRSFYDLPHYAHSQDCRKHYVCVRGSDDRLQPRQFACDYGQVFNPETSSCDKPANVYGCENYYAALYSDNDFDAKEEAQTQPPSIPRRRKPANSLNN